MSHRVAWLVKFTYHGDANLDGSVNSTDQSMINAGATAGLTGWTNGDFNYDGTVDGSDLSLLDNMTNTGGQNQYVPGGTITLAADANFPVSSLPTTTPTGEAIASWQADFGNGYTQTFLPTDTVANPYVDANAQYSATLIPLDANGNPEYYYPHMTVNVTQVGPSSLSATSVSPNEIDLAWPAYSSTCATNIYISTDGTDFSYFDTAAAGQTSYQAMGLVPGTSYTFEITALSPTDSESAAATTAAATTAIDPWNVQANGSSGILEGATYSLTLSTNPIAGAPAFGQWTVDWGDTSNDTPDISTYTTADVTATHIFATDIDSTIIDITASTADGTADPFTVAAQSIEVDMVPTAPENVQTTVFSPTEIDLSWTNASQDADNNEILRSLDGGATFQTIATVAGSDDSYEDTSLAAGDTAEYCVAATGVSAADISTSQPSTTVTTPTTPASVGEPSLSVTLSSNSSGSAILTWTYQGSDDSGFELEMLDEQSGENFHTFATPGPVSASGMGTTTVTGLTAGDTYDFRMRADHTGGTASRYTVPVCVTVGASLAPAPLLSIETDPTFSPRLAWSGAGDSIEIQVTGDPFAGSGWRTITYRQEADPAWPSNFKGSENGWFGSGWYPNDPAQGWLVGPEMQGNGVYEYRIRSFDSAGNPTAWSNVVSYDLTANPPPAGLITTPTLQFTATDTAITVSFNPAVSVNYFVDETLFMQAEGPGGSVGVGIPISSYSTLFQGSNIAGSPPNLTFTKTFNDLTPGTQYAFCLWTQTMPNTSDDYGPPVFTKADFTTNGTGNVSLAAPSAPDKLSAVNLGDGVNEDKVELIWSNTPNRLGLMLMTG